MIPAEMNREPCRFAFTHDALLGNESWKIRVWPSGSRHTCHSSDA